MIVRIATAAALAVVLSSPTVARDYISIAGSSTVLPFATIVAERLGRGSIKRHQWWSLAVLRSARKGSVMVSEQSLSISGTRPHV